MRYQPNIVLAFDSRRLPFEELLYLYYSAHAFAFPSYGEGFGLTLAEAMATGLPCVYTPYGGVLDFAKGVALPFDLIDLPAADWFPADVDAISKGWAVDSKLAQANPNFLALAMAKVITEYQRHRRDAAKAGEQIYGSLTWDRSAALLESAINSALGARMAA